MKIKVKFPFYPASEPEKLIKPGEILSDLNDGIVKKIIESGAGEIIEEIDEEAKAAAETAEKVKADEEAKAAEEKEEVREIEDEKNTDKPSEPDAENVKQSRVRK